MVDTRSPIYYDSNDTGYYVNPNSSSRLHNIVVGDGTPDTTPDGTTFSNTIKSTGNKKRVINFEGVGKVVSTWYTSGNTALGAIDQDITRMSFWQNLGSGWARQFSIFKGYQESENQLRAPIFYDSNNTSYRADFTDSGNSIVAAGSYNAQNYNKPALLLNASGTGSSGAAFGMQQVTAEGWTGVFVDYEPYTGWGLYHDHPNNYFCVTSSCLPFPILLFPFPSLLSFPPPSYEKISLDQNNGNIISGGSMYASSYIDQNNKGYYLDPNTTGTSLNVAGKINASNFNGTNFKYLGTGVSYDINSRTTKVSDGIAIYGAYSGGSNSPHTYDMSMQVVGNSRGFELSAAWWTQPALYIRTWRDCCTNWSSWYAIAIHGLNLGSTAPPLYAGAYYDSGNTGYYVDPASASNLAGNVLITSGKLKVSTASLTYGTGYNFHNIENTNSNEPICVFYHSVPTTAVQFYGLNVISAAAHNNTTSRFFLGQGGSTERIKIYSNGNIQNSNNSYGQLSDINLKENIVDATPKLDEINQVRVVNFNYIDDVDEETGIPNKQIGVVAQELEEIFPGMVYECGDTETPTKSVKYSVFVPMLIKAIQEQQTIIDDLKSRIETLENQ